MEPIILPSARQRPIADEDILHAYDNPVRTQDLSDGLRMITGLDRALNLLEIGVVLRDGQPLIVHAMAARAKFLPRRPKR